MSDSCPMCGTQLAEGSRFCHRCGLPLSSQAPQLTSSAGAARVAHVLIALGWLDCAIGSLLLLTGEVGMIVLPGLILAGLGAMTFVAGLLAPSRRVRLVGLVHIGFCVFLFILLTMQGPGGGPSVCPVFVVTVAYTVVSLLLGSWAWADSPWRVNPWVCARCGYLLRGLTEPRCPECGTTFDPEELRPPSSDSDDLAED